MDRYEWIALCLGLAGVLWRVWLTFMDAPLHNSDEAVIGWAAIHIGDRIEYPIYFYGQNYMGTIEAWLAAPLIKLFGPSIWALRVITLSMYVLFLLIMFVFVRRVFSAGLAVVTIGLLAFGAHRTVFNQLIAGGGYPESGPMVAGLLLLTYLLAARLVTQWYAFAGWGLLYGLVVWNHWLPAPYLACALVMLAVSRAADWRRWLATVASAVLGATPTLIDWSRSGVSPIAELTRVGTSGGEAALIDRLYGGVYIGLPFGMGGCPPMRCESWSLWWSPVFLGLIIAAIVLAVRGLFRRADVVAGRSGATDPAADGGGRPDAGGDPDGDTGSGPGGGTGRVATMQRETATATLVAADPVRVEKARHGIRLVLAISGLGLLASYVQSPGSYLYMWESARYLSLLTITLPVLLWPVWTVVRRTTAAPALRALAALPILGLAAILFAGTVFMGQKAFADHAEQRDRDELLSVLREREVRYVRAEYWTCNWITYLTDTKTVCGVVEGNGKRGFNRYAHYWWRRTPTAVIAPVGSPLDATYRDLAPAPPQRINRFHVYWYPPPR